MFNKLKNSSRQKKIITLGIAVSVLCLIIAAGIFIDKYAEGVKAEQEGQKLLAFYNEAADNIKDAKNKPITYKGFDIIAKLSIEKIGLTLPVISKYDEKALGISLCYYQGAMPGQEGNMIITGHNYSSGAHFGKLNKLAIGDEVTLETPDGKKYTYKVYEITAVKPDDVTSLYKYNGKKALTLLTCTSNANKRLLVRCKM